MLSDLGATASGRLVVQKFAAHLAHLLNAGDTAVALNAGELYRKLLRTLSGGGQRGEGNPYVDKLIAVHLLGPDMPPDQAAMTYFERVLNRPLFLARSAHSHKGHEVFLALCRRGLDDSWAVAELGRSRDAPAAGAIGAAPHDFETVSARMAEVCQRHRGHISAGNPAASTRAEHGRLYLRVSHQAIEVAEELSLWEAICAGPEQMRVLAPEDFDEFCSLVIKAVEAANAHYGALVTLRLSPLDWAGELSINTAKKVSAFLSDVRAEAEATGAAAEAVEAWEVVWARRQVPGYTSARSLWASPLGYALRSSGTLSRPPAHEDRDDEGDDDARIDRNAIPDMVNKYRQAGILDGYDAWLLRQLGRRKTLRQLAKSPRTLLKFGRADIPEDYIADLRDRVRRFHELKPSR